MRWGWCGLAAALLMSGLATAQDAARMQQLVAQVEARSAAFWPGGRVLPGSAALFRGELADARQALEELIAMGEPAIPALGRLLQHPSAHCRANAAWALARIGGPKTAASLAAAAGDPNPGVRFQVAQALGYTASPAALPALDRLAGDADGTVRNEAVKTGGMLRDVLAAEQAATVEDRIGELVAIAASDVACARLISYGAAAVPALIKALDSEDRGVVTGAAYCLSRIGAAEGIEPLWTHFTASLAQAPQTRLARFLAEYRNPAVWPHLVEILANAELDEKAPIAQQYVLERLATFDHPERLKTVNDFVQRQIQAGRHKTVVRGSTTTESPVAAACVLLGQIGDATSAALLDQIIAEAPPPEKSIVKPLAEAAKAAIAKRGG